MTSSSLLIVPGYHGSDLAHWQSWLLRNTSESRMLDGVDWEKPVLADWAERVRNEIARARSPLWIVAHSFGCLATAVAVADRPSNVAGIILVAPCDPAAFNLLGPGAIHDDRLTVKTLTSVMPRQALNVKGRLIGSSNDAWLSLTDAQRWAQTWNLEFIDAGQAGHINSESGFGPWPFLLELLRTTQGRSDAAHPCTPRPMTRGRGSLLAKVRQHTRLQLSLFTRCL